MAVELEDGATERVDTQAPPGFDERVFALLSEGDIHRAVVDVRAIR